MYATNLETSNPLLDRDWDWSDDHFAGFEEVTSDSDCDDHSDYSDSEQQVVPASSDERSLHRNQARLSVLRRIEHVFRDILEALGRGRPPQIVLPRDRARYNPVTGFTRPASGPEVDRKTRRIVKFGAKVSTRTFAVFVRVLEICHGLLTDQVTLTKRDLYYMDVPLFGSQGVVDRAVDDIARMFDVPRSALNVRASSKGLVAGAISLVMKNGSSLDCAVTSSGDQGFLIPPHEIIEEVRAEKATFVMVVEKEATFRHLIARGFCQDHPDAILVTGKGYPDVSTRRFVKLLDDCCKPTSAPTFCAAGKTYAAEDGKIPILALVDSDPHGVAIYFTFKHSSSNLAHEDGLATPRMQWIGLHTGDWKRFDIQDTQLMPLSVSDRKKGHWLLEGDIVKHQPRVRKELSRMLFQGHKAELQSLVSDHPSFLVEHYLPEKLVSPQDWL